MSEIIYDNVIATESLENGRGERVEMMVAIYESSDSVRNTKRQQAHQHTGSVSVKNRRHGAVQVCLWLLCVLLLTAGIVLCVYFTTDRNRLLTQNHNLTKERVKFLKQYTEILNQNRNLTEEREQIKNKTDELQCTLTEAKHHNLLEEKDRCILKSKSVSEQRDQLMNERKELNRWLTEQDRRSDNFKWVYYNFNFYYISSEKKSWSDSKQDCHQRGADLVILNSKEEQEFLQKATAGSLFWIGLRKEKGVWKWADKTTFTTRYWMKGHLGPYSDYCGLTSTSGLSDDSCNDKYGWICERIVTFLSI